MAKPIKDGASKNLIEAFNTSLVLRFGVPDTLITDRGLNIMSAEFQSYLKSMNIKHTPTSAYHPRCDGQTERFNAVLGTGLSINNFSAEHSEEWERYVDELLFAYNPSTHATTGCPPFYLVHGYEPRPFESKM